MALSEITMFVLGVAVAGLHVLNLLVESLQHADSPHSPVLVCIACLFMPALATAYNMGIILVYLQVAPPQPALMPPVALKRFAALACAIAAAVLVLLLIATPLVRTLFLSGDGLTAGDGIN